MMIGCDAYPPRRFRCPQEGERAPKRSELGAWLLEHPGWKPFVNFPGPAPEGRAASVEPTCKGVKDEQPSSRRERLIKEAEDRANALWQKTLSSAAKRVDAELEPPCSTAPGAAGIVIAASDAGTQARSRAPGEASEAAPANVNSAGGEVGGEIAACGAASGAGSASLVRSLPPPSSLAQPAVGEEAASRLRAELAGVVRTEIGALELRLAAAHKEQLDAALRRAEATAQVPLSPCAEC